MLPRKPSTGPWRGVRLAYTALAALSLGASSGARAESTVLTLPQALEAALSRRAEIEVFASDLRASEGALRQAALRPNPELEFELSNLADEATVTYTQPLETGGKRQARIDLASASARVLRSNQTVARRDIEVEVRRTFVSLLGAQKRMALQREAYELAVRLATTVSERVAAGAASPIEATRARVALSSASAEVERARRQFEEARVALSAAMGDPAPGFGEATGELREDVGPRDAVALADRLTAGPDLARWEDERKKRAAALAVERSLALSDVTVFGGLGYARENDAGTVTLGVSIPLPLFHRNEGAIQEAEAALSKAEAERRGTEARALAQLEQSLASLTGAAREARILRDEVLSGARDAFETVSEGYRLGKFPYLDVLDAGRALIEARLQHLDALVSLNLAHVDVERLTGEPAPAPASPDRKN